MRGSRWKVDGATPMKLDSGWPHLHTKPFGHCTRLLSILSSGCILLRSLDSYVSEGFSCMLCHVFLLKLTRNQCRKHMDRQRPEHAVSFFVGIGPPLLPNLPTKVSWKQEAKRLELMKEVPFLIWIPKRFNQLATQEWMIGLKQQDVVFSDFVVKRLGVSYQ